MIDYSTLTLGEIAKIEELSGLSFKQIEEIETPMGLLLAALVFVVKRRTGHPGVTWNEACAVTLEEANEILGLNAEDDDDPKDESEPSEPTTSPTSSSTSG